MIGKLTAKAGAYKLDGVSIVFSSLCVIHCVLLPLFLTTLTVWGFELLENPFIETAMIMVSVIAGAGAIIKGFRKHHRNLSIVILFFAGLGLMVSGNFLTDEVFLKSFGAALIICSHLLNINCSVKCRV